jgi:hypothetical protein
MLVPVRLSVTVITVKSMSLKLLGEENGKIAQLTGMPFCSRRLTSPYAFHMPLF